MAIENQLSRYGAISKVLPLMGPNAKVFFVGASTLPSFTDFQAAYPVDKDGGNRIFTTIAAAIADANVVTARGDVILLLPGHTESISTATALTVSKGVSIVGLGYGTLRATITLDTGATSTINVSAANVRFENCIFVANFADIASAFTTTTAKALTLVDCEFRDTDATHNFVRIVDTNTTTADADDMTLLRCKRMGLGATTATTIIKMDGTNARLTVKDCYFAHLNVDDGGLFMIIAAGKIVTDAAISGNIFNFLDVSSATAGILITTNGSTNSGYLANNFVKHLDTTTEILVTASSGFVFFQNFASAVADKSGYLLPAADA